MAPLFGSLADMCKSYGLIISGPPSPPYDIHVDNIQHTTVSLSWKRGFHGGFEQTFVIQLSKDKFNWSNITSVNGMLSTSKDPISKTLDGLDDSTTYFVRMFAYNIEGNSTYTDYLNYTTLTIGLTIKYSCNNCINMS